MGKLVRAKTALSFFFVWIFQDRLLSNPYCDSHYSIPRERKQLNVSEVQNLLSLRPLNRYLLWRYRYHILNPHKIMLPFAIHGKHTAAEHNAKYLKRDKK